jgi:hypothetical protein
VLGRAKKQLDDTHVEGVVGLPRAVEPAPIVEAVDAALGKPLGRTDDGRAGNVQILGDADGAATRCEPGHGLEPQRGVGVAAPAALPHEKASLDAIHLGYLRHGWSSRGWVGRTSQTRRRAALFPSMPTRDRDSRSVI